MLPLSAHLSGAGHHVEAWRRAEDGGEGGGGGVGVGGRCLGVRGPIVEEPGRPLVGVRGGDLLTARLRLLVSLLRIGGTWRYRMCHRSDDVVVQISQTFL